MRHRCETGNTQYCAGGTPVDVDGWADQATIVDGQLAFGVNNMYFTGSGCASPKVAEHDVIPDRLVMAFGEAQGHTHSALPTHRATSLGAHC